MTSAWFLHNTIWIYTVSLFNQIAYMYYWFTKHLVREQTFATAYINHNIYKPHMIKVKPNSSLVRQNNPAGRHVWLFAKDRLAHRTYHWSGTGRLTRTWFSSSDQTSWRQHTGGTILGRRQEGGIRGRSCSLHSPTWPLLRDVNLEGTPHINF